MQLFTTGVAIVALSLSLAMRSGGPIGLSTQLTAGRSPAVPRGSGNFAGLRPGPPGWSEVKDRGHEAGYAAGRREGRSRALEETRAVIPVSLMRRPINDVNLW